MSWCVVFGCGLSCCSCLCFFCKQKTAYEMRISDWSSDVCSSDLRAWARPCRRKDAPMLRYILLRVAATVPVMAVVALFVFLLLRLTPGDPAAVIAGDYATAEDIVRIRERLGLKEPLPLQFITWVGLQLTGAPGPSLLTRSAAHTYELQH